MEVEGCCKYTCSLGMEFFNLQVYMQCLAMRSRWCRSLLDTVSANPRHKKGENTEPLRFTIFWDIHSSNFYQKSWLCLQFQKRWNKVSVVSSQKEQESTCFMPILQRKSFVAIRLCRNLNWNTLSFVSLVQRNGRQFRQLTVEFLTMSFSESHFTSLCNGIVGLLPTKRF